MSGRQESGYLKRVDAPDWLLALWQEIDSRCVGKSLEVLADGAELRLGASVALGKAAVREMLASADPAMETHHEIVACWSDGRQWIVQGRLRMTIRASGEERETVVGHFIEMDDEAGKILRWSGAVGPLG